MLKIGLTAPREVIKKRIFSRLISRIDQGLIKEAEELYKGGLTLKRMEELGLEYGMLARFLNKEVGENKLIEGLSTKIYQYAKRQMTWFKRDREIKWFDITSQDVTHKMEKEVATWYYMQDDQKN